MKKLLIFLALLTSCTSPVVLKVPDAHAVKLSWNKPEWDAFLVSQVYLNFDSLSKAKDITKFCPRFNELTKREKIGALSELLIGIMYYESSFNPNSRMVETGLGIDPITKQQVVSEGLLQLSYQDQRGYPFCKFDWEKDKLLPIEKRSITSPELNMQCGVGILAHQINKKGSFEIQTSYWSVLRKKADLIAARVVKNFNKCN